MLLLCFLSLQNKKILSFFLTSDPLGKAAYREPHVQTVRPPTPARNFISAAYKVFSTI